MTPGHLDPVVEEAKMSKKDQTLMDEVSENDKSLMAEYGVTSSTKRVYFYKGYRYDRLSDALSYASSDTKHV